MWSQWVCDNKILAVLTPRSSNALPRLRIPLPQSKIYTSSPATTSTQLVLPPKSIYSGEGVAILPRTPQNFTAKAIPKLASTASKKHYDFKEISKLFTISPLKVFLIMQIGKTPAMPLVLKNVSVKVFRAICEFAHAYPF